MNLLFVRNPRARRYYLRVRPDGAARVTIPRGGSLAEAQRFAERHREWLDTARARLAARQARSTAWKLGHSIHFEGELVPLAPVDDKLRLGRYTVPLRATEADLRPFLERCLRRIATIELPPRVLTLAAQHSLSIKRVTVRSQKSRWGSCSSRGTISLNWCLIQAPPSARDYVILHELMHLRQMNHSERFWREVAAVCPNYKEAEAWLRQHAHLLR